MKRPKTDSRAHNAAYELVDASNLCDWHEPLAKRTSDDPDA
jgi:hypothetical protein